MAEVCCRTSFKLSTVIFHWKIENFSFLETDGETHFVESDEFRCSEDPQTKFRLRLYPSWSNTLRTTLEKVDVRVFFNNTSDKKTIVAKFSFWMVSNSNEKIIKKDYPVTTYVENKEYFLTSPGTSRANCFCGAGVLPNDVLNLFCEVTMNVGKVQESHTVFKMEEPMASQLPRDLSHLLDSGDFSDVEFVVDTETFQAHKNILVSRSPVFAAMFKHSMKENNQNRVEIVDVDPKIFRQMLHFVYTGKFPENQNIDTRMAKDLLVAADKYDIRDLKDTCERFLQTI